MYFMIITFCSIRSFIPEPHIISISLMIIIMYHKFQNSQRALLLNVDLSMSAKYLIVSLSLKENSEIKHI